MYIILPTTYYRPPQRTFRNLGDTKFIKSWIHVNEHHQNNQWKSKCIDC